MQQRQKCCSQCPGNWTSGSSELRDHTCCLPKYVRGNLKLSSLSKMYPNEAERSEKLREKCSISRHENERPSSCYNRFSIAKKFHAENLQHQPLPDRVDDSIFKNTRTPKNAEIITSGDTEKRNISENFRPSRYSQKMKTSLQYGPTLGCKTPSTNMDLAICWEAPLDPTYEPPRKIHIDGTNGGPAPAIFALVEREIPSEKNHRESGQCLRHPVEVYEAKFSNLRNSCRCICDQPSDSKNLKIDESSNDSKNPDDEFRKPSENLEFSKKCNDEKKQPECSDNNLCDDLESLRITDKRRETLSSAESTKQAKLPLHLRNCSSCQCRGDPAARKPRITQSAHSGLRNIRRNGLPTKINVPRPRTPYAKRSFCIDTLTPPFSIINGCRDADYPEHWRLTSVYQQSYRNPLKQKGTILNWS